MRPVLVLRAEPGAQATAARAAAIGLEAIVAPLFRVVPVPWTMPAEPVDAVMLTSANAVRHGGIGALTGLPAFVVGTTTAAAARGAGFRDVHSANGNGAALLALVERDRPGRVLHLVGREHILLDSAVVPIVRRTVYAAEAVDRLPGEVVAALADGAVALLHSPRAAELFGRLVDEAGIARAGLAVAAISAAAAGTGWARQALAARPDDDALLAAARELRQMSAMDRDYDDAIEPAPPRTWLRILILLLVAFVAGAIAMGWMLTHWGAAQRYLRQAEPVAAIPLTMPRASAPIPLAAALPPAPPGALDQRLATIETHIDQIDRRASAAVGNADRAEGLLVAFAARRALDRGADLGYIEGLLRERFGGSQPQAVATIISAAHQPVTIEELQSGLDEVAPLLVGEGPRDNWWDAFRRELGGLIVVRRAGVASTAPGDRVERAQRALEIGRVDIALAEVARLPGRANAAAWIVKARRYTASRGALDQIETAALLDPQVGQRPAATGAWTE